MNISSKSLGLGLVLFLGACSVTEGKFLDKVAGKEAYEFTVSPAPVSVLIGTFSEDGKKFTWKTYPGSGYEAMEFIDAIDENTATYSLSETQTSTIKTIDGKMGTITRSGEPTIEFFFK